MAEREFDADLSSRVHTPSAFVTRSDDGYFGKTESASPDCFVAGLDAVWRAAHNPARSRLTASRRLAR